MKSLNLLFVAIAFLLFNAFQHQAVNAQGTVTVAREGNVVARPTAADSILAQVKEGNVLTLLQMDNDWAKVALSKKKKGWLRREMLILPSPDSLLIGRDWPIMQERGFDWRSADTAKAKAGYVRKGMNVKRILAQGAWYEIELVDGVRGWLPHHVIEPSPIEIIRLGSETNLIPDTTNHLNNTRSAGHVVEGTKLIQLAKGPGWSKVRTPEGLEGWVEQSLLEIEGALPRKANSVFWYRVFDGLDKFGEKHFLLGLIVFAIQWIVIPLLPVYVVFLAYYFTVGNIKVINNAILKIGYCASMIFVGFKLIVDLYPTVPPYMGGFAGYRIWIMQVLSFFMMLYGTMGQMRFISYDRCNKCRKFRAGKIVGSQYGGASSNVEIEKVTYGFADGHHQTETHETTTRSSTKYNRLRCEYCGHTWVEAETTTSKLTRKV